MATRVKSKPKPKGRAKAAAKPAVKTRAKTGSNRALETYRRKRDFNKTPEPGAVVQSSAEGNSYLIQKHAARRLHYDFRLELDGVLLSWAVPNGPSLDPADKRLAVRTEDHPLEYGKFEGVIPAGEYGGGTVMLWDRGSWEPVGDPHAGIKNGDFKFILHGERLHGKWVLVRMRKRADERGDKENWLLIKERDDEAKPGHGKALTEKDLPSVVSQRSMGEIADQRQRVWSSKSGELAVNDDTPTKKGSTGKQSQDTQAKLMGKAKNAAPTMPKALAEAKRSALPDFVAPELCALVDDAPDGARWVHEIKLDGYRTQVRLEKGKARMLTRKGLDWTAKFKSIAKLIEQLPAKSALIDGEIVMLDTAGVSSFSGLQDALSNDDDSSLIYYAFDLLHLDGKNLTKLPLADRKAALAALFGGLPPDGRLRYSSHVAGRGKDVFEHACRLGLEGIVSKLGDSPYRGGRGGDWLKVKCTHRQEFVIGGWLSSSAAGRDLRSILVGYFEQGKFVYAGKIGTGFNDRSGGALATQLRKLARKDPPFVGQLPAEVRRGAQWVEPKLVVEAEFAAWTSDRILRHAAFKGVREDKDAKEITIELPGEDAADAKPAARAVRDSATASPAKGKPARPNAPPRTYGGVKLTHPDRVLWPDDGVTKQALADYYAVVAPLIMPHIENRPLSLVRCPDGIAGQCFFQRHMGQGLPDAVKPAKVRDEKQAYLTITDTAGLFSLVQFSTLEIHPWGARVDDPEHPDRIVMDFDPHESVPWKSVVAAAIDCRDRLADMGLTSFVKTTGGKGLHVVVPLDRKQDWDEVRGFAEALAKTMAKDNRLYITTMTKSARTGRIFIDYLRNARTSTAIAPYSTRSRPGAPVAAPLDWDELKTIPSGGHFTLTTLPRRLSAMKKDPWAAMFKTRQSLTQKAKKAVGLA